MARSGTGKPGGSLTAPGKVLKSGHLSFSAMGLVGVESVMAAQKAGWTVITYLAAHNNLEGLGRRSLAQIQGVGSTPALRLAALYDGPDGATRFTVGGPGQDAVSEELNDLDSG